MGPMGTKSEKASNPVSPVRQIFVRILFRRRSGQANPELLELASLCGLEIGELLGELVLIPL